MFLLQEKFAEHKVLDAVLALLSLINVIQLERLNQQINTTAKLGLIEQTLESETEANHGLLLTHVAASPSENVSIMAEEGECFFLFLFIYLFDDLPKAGEFTIEH